MVRWLLLVPILLLLITPVYNRLEPRLLGMPFFYWYQLACAVVAMVLIAVVLLAQRGRR